LSFLIFGTCKNKRINSGTYIGKAQDIHSMLLKACNKFKCKFDANNKNNDDQVLLTKYCNISPSEIHIDDNNELFLVLNGALNHFDMDKYGIKIINGNVIYKDKSSPCFIHGIGATNMNTLITKLGYNNPTPITYNDTLKYDIVSIKHFSYYLRYYILIVLMLCIILFVIAASQQIK